MVLTGIDKNEIKETNWYEISGRLDVMESLTQDELEELLDGDYEIVNGTGIWYSYNDIEGNDLTMDEYDEIMAKANEICIKKENYNIYSVAQDETLTDEEKYLVETACYCYPEEHLEGIYQWFHISEQDAILLCTTMDYPVLYNEELGYILPIGWYGISWKYITCEVYNKDGVWD